MQESHRRAAELHALAAKHHRSAAEHNERGDQDATLFHSIRAMEFADHAYKLAKQAHTKSGKIGDLH